MKKTFLVNSQLLITKETEIFENFNSFEKLIQEYSTNVYKSLTP